MSKVKCPLCDSQLQPACSVFDCGTVGVFYETARLTCHGLSYTGRACLERQIGHLQARLTAVLAVATRKKP